VFITAEPITKLFAWGEGDDIAEVPLATLTMQGVQDSWKGLVTRRAGGL
jgi:hypothetical protein